MGHVGGRVWSVGGVNNKSPVALFIGPAPSAGDPQTPPQRLPSLETALAESRKYGGCVLAGVQSVPQLTHLYGLNQSQAILDLLNTKVFFRNTDPNTNQWISKVLGDVEITEPHESLSYGAHRMRDGVSLSYQNRMKPLVLPTEIASLHDLEAFVKLPGDYPIGRVKMKWRG